MSTPLTPAEHAAVARKWTKDLLALLDTPYATTNVVVAMLARAQAHSVLANLPGYPPMEWGQEHETGQTIEWMGYVGSVVLDGDGPRFRWSVRDGKTGLGVAQSVETAARYEARLGVERALVTLVGE